MPDLRARADGLINAVAQYGADVDKAARFVKVVMVCGGATVIALAQCISLPATGNWPLWSIVGLIGTAIAFIGGLFVAFTDTAAGNAVAVAHRTLEDAREAQTEANAVDYLFDEIRRATQLYGAVELMRTAVETMLQTPPQTEEMLSERSWTSLNAHSRWP